MPKIISFAGILAVSYLLLSCVMRDRSSILGENPIIPAAWQPYCLGQSNEKATLIFQYTNSAEALKDPIAHIKAAAFDGFQKNSLDSDGPLLVSYGGHGAYFAADPINSSGYGSNLVMVNLKPQSRVGFGVYFSPRSSIGKRHHLEVLRSKETAILYSWQKSWNTERALVLRGNDPGSVLDLSSALSVVTNRAKRNLGELPEKFNVLPSSALVERVGFAVDFFDFMYEYAVISGGKSSRSEAFKHCFILAYQMQLLQKKDKFDPEGCLDRADAGPEDGQQFFAEMAAFFGIKPLKNNREEVLLAAKNSAEIDRLSKKAAFFLNIVESIKVDLDANSLDSIKKSFHVPLDGSEDPGVAEVAIDTMLKRSIAPSTELKAAEKCALPLGTQLNFKYAEPVEASHYQLQLDQSLELCPKFTGKIFVYGPHFIFKEN